jgi:hypothetical protein
VARNQAARILCPEAPFDPGFKDVATLRDGGGGKAQRENGEDPPRIAEGVSTGHGAETRSGEYAGKRAGPGFRGRNFRPEFGAADEVAAEISENIGAPHDREKPHDRSCPIFRRAMQHGGGNEQQTSVDDPAKSPNPPPWARGQGEGKEQAVPNQALPAKYALATSPRATRKKRRREFGAAIRFCHSQPTAKAAPSQIRSKTRPPCQTETSAAAIKTIAERTRGRRSAKQRRPEKLGAGGFLPGAWAASFSMASSTGLGAA